MTLVIRLTKYRYYKQNFIAVFIKMMAKADILQCMVPKKKM